MALSAPKAMATDSDPGGRQYHLQVGPGEIGKYVLLPGDPARTDRIAGYLEGTQMIGDNREFRTWTGLLNGVHVSTTSTGVGCPSAAIAVTELLRLGAHTFIRVGSCGAFQDAVRSGEIIVATGAVRDEGTTRQYVPIEYPAVAHPTLVAALAGAAETRNLPHQAGIVYCKDAITAAFPPDEIPLSEQLSARTRTWIKAGVLASEMESAAIFVLASIAGARAASVLKVIGPGDEASPDHLSDVIEIALAAVVQLINGDTASADGAGQ